MIWIWVLILNFLDLCLNLFFCVDDIVLMFKWVCDLELVSFVFLSMCCCVPWMELVLDLVRFCWMKGDSRVCVLIFWSTLCLVLNFLGVFVLWVCCVWFLIFCVCVWFWIFWVCVLFWIFWGCLYCEYVVFDFEFSGFVLDFEFFGFMFNIEFFIFQFWIFWGKKKTQNFF